MQRWFYILRTMEKMRTNTKVIVGVSGGVDSATALYLLKEQGWDVTAVTMEIYKGNDLNPAAAAISCYGHEKQDLPEIKALCAKLNVPFYSFDLSNDFGKLIISYFKSEYEKGHTPNPCIRCNRYVKFDLLPKAARLHGLDFDFFATGHYAKIIKHENGRYYLARPFDKSKDQTYFLHLLSQEQLAATYFPLADFTKEQVRRLATERLGSIGDKKDSQDFYGGDYNDILNLPERKGKIVHKDGKVLGFHNGFWNYTLGQRKGLGIAYPEPLYVTGLDSINNRVIVAEGKYALTDTVQVKDFSLYPVSDSVMYAKVRSAGKMLQVSEIENHNKDNQTATIHFAEPTLTPAPSQSLVIYQDDLVIASGIIG